MWCASLTLRRKYKVHEVGFVTAATGLLHLHYDSKNTQTHTHTHKPSNTATHTRRVTTVVHLTPLQCSASGVAIEFVPLKRIWNLNSTGLCWAAVICATATITLCVNLSKWHWLTVITKPKVEAHFHGVFSFNSHLAVFPPKCHFTPSVTVSPKAMRIQDHDEARDKKSAVENQLIIKDKIILIY